MAYFVLGLGLFAKDCYRQVDKNLQRFRLGCTPARNTLSEARKALGVAPLRRLAAMLIGLLATPSHTPDAFHHGLRLMALDGFVLDVPDSPDNARVFGKPQSGRAEGAFPHARVLALCETGTHVLDKHLIKPCRRSEVSMTAALLPYLAADMLLLWDRNFLSYKHLQRVNDRQAQLLARVKSNWVLAPTAELADGS